MLKLFSRITLPVLLAISIAVFTLPAQAQSDAEVINELRASIEILEKRLSSLEDEQQEEVKKFVTVQELAAVQEFAAVQEKKERMWDSHLYGSVRISVDNRSGEFADNSTSLSSNASRVGAYGTIHIPSSDISAIYLAEMQYEATQADQTPFSFRESYAGIKSQDWGTLRLGRLTTAYKVTLEKVDPWVDNAFVSHAFGRQGSSEFHANFFNSAIDYVTPDFGNGIKASLWYSLALSDSSRALHNTDSLKKYVGGSAGGVGVQYEVGPLFLGADYIGVDADNINLAGLSNGSGYQLAAKYTLWDRLTLGAFYEDVGDLGLGKNYFVNAIYRHKRYRFIASYGGNDDADVYGNNEVTNWNLGMKYDLSKHSELIVGFDRRTDNDLDHDFNTFSFGINTSFGN